MRIALAARTSDRKRQSMHKLILIALVAAAAQFVLSGPAQASKKSAREICCLKYKGIWRADRYNGIMKCYGLSKASIFYKCVAKGGR